MDILVKEHFERKRFSFYTFFLLILFFLFFFFIYNLLHWIFALNRYIFNDRRPKYMIKIIHILPSMKKSFDRPHWLSRRPTSTVELKIDFDA